MIKFESPLYVERILLYRHREKKTNTNKALFLAQTPTFVDLESVSSKYLLFVLL